MSDVSRFPKFISLISWVAFSSVLTVLTTQASFGNSAQANPLNSKSPEKIAAVSQPSSPALLIEKSQPVNQSEADLIQQLSGQATSVQPVSAAMPSFAPPAATVPIAAQSVQRPEPDSPSLVASTLSGSDVSANLVPKTRFKASTASIRGINPDAFNSTISLQSPTTAPAAPAIAVQNKANFLAQSGRNAEMLGRPNRPFMRSTALTPPSLTFQGVFLYQGDETSARARLYGVYPLSPSALVGATLDVTTGNSFTDTPENGFNVNELYFAMSPRDIPNLRFVVGQIDFTSYFDRNSFAKDGATHFFNPIFQTNPALSATGIASRPGALVNFSLTDNIEAKAAVFSSSKGLSDFALDGFAGELGMRYGNLIVRGTYATDRDSGSNSGFQEIFQLSRGGGRTGLLKGDREQAYGVNAEVFIPNLKMGIFGRYGRYNNLDLDESGDTFSGGITFLDLFSPDDRLGLAYGRALSNDKLRRNSGENVPDALELFYDFKLLSNLRVGFSVQQRNNFSETIAGVRLRSEFDVTPRGRLVQ
ncbi:hypothetical protein Q2T42_14680 [Leptolyngbya boryana CZ1]|uniref:Porin n=1 Tax=Leptolyngbya boryana CZ1 TaxID=3060204 RepID=A0AA96X146_LEPBY|nr:MULTISPECIES: carbohydrate porin [Leptolyngbya]MBD1858073.1 porin [Leptolyngbya sp. FACHB-1624]WNZ49067.1 hypothetical protein Q2T42_14680 [Leptolyngbya boryana CZ1]